MEIPNVIQEPPLVSSIYSEFLSLINYYQNVKRPSIFIRYYNIDIDRSVAHDQTNTTYDLYNHAGIIWNLYDLTPVYSISPIVNTGSNVSDLKGQLMDGNTTIVTYAIKEPRYNDLVMFYEPTRSAEEIFRVVGIRAAINAVKGSTPVTWWELELEYAPIVNCQNWTSQHVRGHFVYDLSKEDFVDYDDYKDELEEKDKIEELLENLCQYYDGSLDMYIFEGEIPVIINELIYLIKGEVGDKYRSFETIPSPFGYLDLVDCNFSFSSLEDIYFPVEPHEDNEFLIINYETKETSSYIWTPGMVGGINDMFEYAYQLYNVV